MIETKEDLKQLLFAVKIAQLKFYDSRDPKTRVEFRGVKYELSDLPHGICSKAKKLRRYNDPGKYAMKVLSWSSDGFIIVADDKGGFIITETEKAWEIHRLANTAAQGNA